MRLFSFRRRELIIRMCFSRGLSFGSDNSINFKFCCIFFAIGMNYKQLAIYLDESGIFHAFIPKNFHFCNFLCFFRVKICWHHGKFNRVFTSHLFDLCPISLYKLGSRSFLYKNAYVMHKYVHRNTLQNYTCKLQLNFIRKFFCQFVGSIFPIKHKNLTKEILFLHAFLIFNIK